MVKSISYDQSEIIKWILDLHVKNHKIDCDPTYSIGNFYKNTGIDKPLYKMDFTDKTVTKGKGLIGKTIKKGQRVRIINVEPHRKDRYICLDEYIGKEGNINYDDILEKNHFGASVTFDKKYMKAIDEENGRLCWRWDEIELID